jgi:hypothetical protein
MQEWTEVKPLISDNLHHPRSLPPFAEPNTDAVAERIDE